MDDATHHSALEMAGVKFVPGINGYQIHAVEEKYKFTFPADLRNFLKYFLPISEGWVDWRNGSNL